MPMHTFMGIQPIITIEPKRSHLIAVYAPWTVFRHRDVIPSEGLLQVDNMLPLRFGRKRDRASYNR